ncbi:MAG: hypothetical protein FT714_07070 [Pantoea sp. Pent]|nr:hypothetical protein [Pantoea sp. Pent]
MAVSMRTTLMTLPQMAHYLDIPCTTLARAMCNRGTLEKLPLPAAVDDSLPLSSRCWLREEVRQFRHRLQRRRHQR